jgi:large subunit ribosomal protein L19
MHPQVRAFEQKQIDQITQAGKLPSFRAGDTLKVTLNIEEGGKKWVQTCECICIAIVNKGISSSFLVRRVEASASVQMRFPLFLPGLNVQVLRRGRVRRAKLYYLERCSRKAGRIKELAPKRTAKVVS